MYGEVRAGQGLRGWVYIYSIYISTKYAGFKAATFFFFLFIFLLLLLLLLLLLFLFSFFLSCFLSLSLRPSFPVEEEEEEEEEEEGIGKAAPTEPGETSRKDEARALFPPPPPPPPPLRSIFRPSSHPAGGGGGQSQSANISYVTASPPAVELRAEQISGSTDGRTDGWTGAG